MVPFLEGDNSFKCLRHFAEAERVLGTEAWATRYILHAAKPLTGVSVASFSSEPAAPQVISY